MHKLKEGKVSATMMIMDKARAVEEGDVRRLFWSCTAHPTTNGLPPSRIARFSGIKIQASNHLLTVAQRVRIEAYEPTSFSWRQTDVNPQRPSPLCL